MKESTAKRAPLLRKECRMKLSNISIFNITGGSYSELVDVTITKVVSDYQPAAEAA